MKFFIKIFEYIKRLFIPKYKQLEDSKNIYENGEDDNKTIMNTKKSFVDEYNMKNQKREERSLMELKRLLDLGKITALDLKKDEISKLQAIYDREISNKMVKLQSLKN